jgi:hypothetical protein
MDQKDSVRQVVQPDRTLLHDGGIIQEELKTRNPEHEQGGITRKEKFTCYSIQTI